MTLQLKKQKGEQNPIEGIAFNQASVYDKIKKSNKFALCYSLYENIWNQRKSIELMVKDFYFDEKENS